MSANPFSDTHTFAACAPPSAIAIIAATINTIRFFIVFSPFVIKNPPVFIWWLEFKNN
jgi:hypothetical protein